MHCMLQHHIDDVILQLALSQLAKQKLPIKTTILLSNMNQQ